MINGFLIACSLYTRIPVKQIDWYDQGRKYVLFYLPLIGALIGSTWWFVGQFLLQGNLIMACILCFFPYLIYGFIHLDGFMDCTDALLSSGNQEKQLLILKDSHVGAFAVLSAIILFLLNFSAIASLTSHWPLFIVPIIARIFAIELQYQAPVLATSLMSKHFMEGVSKRLKIYFHLVPIFIGLLSLYFIGYPVLVLWGYAIFHYFVVRTYLMKTFGGINGDMCGFMIESMQCGCLIVACFI